MEPQPNTKQQAKNTIPISCDVSGTIEQSKEKNARRESDSKTACSMVAQGSEYVAEMEGIKIFRKRK